MKGFKASQQERLRCYIKKVSTLALLHPPHAPTPKPQRNNHTEYYKRKDQEGVNIDVITPPHHPPPTPPETPEKHTTIVFVLDLCLRPHSMSTFKYAVKAQEVETKIIAFAGRRTDWLLACVVKQSTSVTGKTLQLIL